ncbi:MAG: DUF374 domain-containing protein [Rhizobiales bacterium]|nr:DUF374 domain-containing protein [Hyphomicrobiales bacterium]
MRPLSMKRIMASRPVQRAIGITGAEYLRFVSMTTKFVVEPSDIYDRVTPDLPVILAMWHGQHFLMPFVKLPHHRAKVLISRHRDGEVNAIAAEWLGVETIRGSGHHGNGHHKGGVTAFMQMVEALKDGYNMALTADVPKVARVAGLGIVMLARASGRPIYPVAIATRNRYEVNNWDRTAINLPFGRGGVVVGLPISVAADADDVALEAARRAVEAALNDVTVRAYALADRPRGGTHG